MSERPELDEIAEVLHDVKTKWKPIGTQLKLSRPTLRCIEDRCKGDPEEAFTEMMDEWLKNADDASWRAIVKALHSRSVGESRLARNVELHKCPNRGEDPSPGSYIHRLSCL